MTLAEELAEAGDLPEEALRRAVRNPGQIAGGVLAALQRAASGDEPSERDGNLVFWGVHVLAQARDTRLFGPLLGVLRQKPEIVGPLLSESLVTTLGRVLASTYDGDAEALAAALLDPAFDEDGRWALFNATTTLVVTGALDRDAAHEVARRFDADRPSAAGELGWVGWAELVTICGFDDLAPQVEAAFAAGRLLDDLIEPAWVAEAFAAALEAPASVYDLDPLQFGFVEDALAELEEVLDGDDDEGEPPEPVVNPLRHVGRNDPCPCGSGRKFKQCCLGKEEVGAAPDKPAVSTLPKLPPLRGR